MKKITLLTGSAALMAALSAPAFAQTEIAAGADATGISGINDRIIDVEDAVQDDFDRDNDAARFGNPDRREGLFGSVALTYTGRDGNDENQDFSLAGRLSEIGHGGRWWAATPRRHWPTDPAAVARIARHWQAPFGDRRQELVFIGTQAMNREAITRALDECQAKGGPVLRRRMINPSAHPAAGLFAAP